MTAVPDLLPTAAPAVRDAVVADLRAAARQPDGPVGARWQRLPFPVAAPVVEHLAGVLPLLAHVPADPTGALAQVRAGQLPAALGLLTPSATFAWSVPGVRGAHRDGGRVALHGRVRYAQPAAAATLTVVELAGTLRLCLLPHDTAGVTATTGGGQPGGWLAVDDALVPVAGLAAPVDWTPTGALVPVLDAYAAVLAAGIAAHLNTTIVDLRRTLAAAESGSGVLSTSQYLAHEVTRLEIETNLLASAAAGSGHATGPPGGEGVLALLAAATGLAHRVRQLRDDLAAELGPPVPGPGPVEPGGWFGGRRMVEAELARRLGLLAGEPAHGADRADRADGTAGNAGTTAGTTAGGTE